jgi:hypothetical protein
MTFRAAQAAAGSVAEFSTPEIWTLPSGSWTSLPPDYYVEVNMAGFSSITDALGGITIDVGPTHCRSAKLPLPPRGLSIICWAFARLRGSCA